MGCMTPTNARRASASTLSESEAIRLAVAGDPAGVEYLYERYKSRIFEVCRRMVGNNDLAADIVQDTFVRAFHNIGTFRGRSRFSTWLYRIATNNVYMNARRAKARITEVSYDQSDTLVPGKLDTMAGRNSGAFESIQLKRAIASLPAGYKVMFILHDIEGYQYAEIAEMLGCSVGNTKSQLHKARLKVRKLICGEVKGSKRRANGPVPSLAMYAGQVQPRRSAQVAPLRFSSL